MSVQNVNTFFEKVRTSGSLRAELKAANGENRESSVKAIIEIATQMSLPFTAEEYEQAMKSHSGPPRPRQQ